MYDQFPVLHQAQVVYLDAAASTPMHESVIATMHDFSTKHYGPVHRSGYKLAQQATQQVEQARTTIATFFNANPKHTIFTRGTTDATNMAIQTICPTKNEHVVYTIVDHHSVCVPAMQYPHTIIHEYTQQAIAQIPKNTKLVCCTYTSNVTGETIDLKSFVQQVKLQAPDCFVLVDAAQTAAHQHIDFSELEHIGVDVLVCSAHKMYGPTGVGILLCSQKFAALQPTKLGGAIVDEVTEDSVVFLASPQRFEPGTPPTVEIVGFAQAVSFLQKIGWSNLAQQEVTEKLYTMLSNHDAVDKVYGTIRSHCISFVTKHHSHDVAALLDEHNIALRAGHLCAQPYVNYLGHKHLLRASVGMFTTLQDIDALDKALTNIHTILGK